jgi:hypothetical protein
METHSPTWPTSSLDAGLSGRGGERHAGADDAVELLGSGRQPVAGRARDASELEDAPSSPWPEHVRVARRFEFDLIARRQAKSISDALRNGDLALARKAGALCVRAS